MVKVKKFLKTETAIAQVELKTRVELCVHVSHSFWVPDVDVAVQKIVQRYGLTRTKERNAILIYLNPRRRRVSIWGDQGIHSHLGCSFWTDWISDLVNHFKSATAVDLDAELAASILKLEPTLARLYPLIAGADNHNELENAVTTE